MTDIQPGKRYRLSIEGTGNTDGWVEYSDGNLASPAFLQMCTVELLPEPLPTTPGSVIRINEGILAMKHAGASWVDENGDQLISSWIERGRWTVLFDAGAERA